MVCVALLQEARADATSDDKSELEELKLLLPDIREKVEDAKESQRTASAASQAIQQTLVGLLHPCFPSLSFISGTAVCQSTASPPQ